MTQNASQQGTDYRARVAAMYAHYAPEKESTGIVDAALKSYEGREEKLLKTLRKKYGPEPTAEPKAVTKEAGEEVANTPMPGWSIPTPSGGSPQSNPSAQVSPARPAAEASSTAEDDAAYPIISPNTAPGGLTQENNDLGARLSQSVPQSKSSLTAIAAAHGVSLDGLAQANPHITNMNASLPVGTKLIMPTPLTRVDSTSTPPATRPTSSTPPSQPRLKSSESFDALPKPEKQGSTGCFGGCAAKPQSKRESPTRLASSSRGLSPMPPAARPVSQPVSPPTTPLQAAKRGMAMHALDTPTFAPMPAVAGPEAPQAVGEEEPALPSTATAAMGDESSTPPPMAPLQEAVDAAVAKAELEDLAQVGSLPQTPRTPAGESSPVQQLLEHKTPSPSPAPSARRPSASPVRSASLEETLPPVPMPRGATASGIPRGTPTRSPTIKSVTLSSTDASAPRTPAEVMSLISAPSRSRQVTPSPARRDPSVTPSSPRKPSSRTASRERHSTARAESPGGGSLRTHSVSGRSAPRPEASRARSTAESKVSHAASSASPKKRSGSRTRSEATKAESQLTHMPSPMPREPVLSAAAPVPHEALLPIPVERRRRSSRDKESRRSEKSGKTASRDVPPQEKEQKSGCGSFFGCNKTTERAPLPLAPASSASRRPSSASRHAAEEKSSARPSSARRHRSATRDDRSASRGTRALSASRRSVTAMSEASAESQVSAWLESAVPSARGSRAASRADTTAKGACCSKSPERPIRAMSARSKVSQAASKASPREVIEGPVEDRWTQTTRSKRRSLRQTNSLDSSMKRVNDGFEATNQ